MADVAEGIKNGMPAGLLAALTEVTWVKSGRSGQLGNCVEVAELPGDQVGVRNSHFPGGPALIFTRDELAAFVGGAKDGDFDQFA